MHQLEIESDSGKDECCSGYFVQGGRKGWIINCDEARVIPEGYGKSLEEMSGCIEGGSMEPAMFTGRIVAILSRQWSGS